MRCGPCIAVARPGLPIGVGGQPADGDDRCCTACRSASSAFRSADACRGCRVRNSNGRVDAERHAFREPVVDHRGDERVAPRAQRSHARPSMRRSAPGTAVVAAAVRRGEIDLAPRVAERRELLADELPSGRRRWTEVVQRAGRGSLRDCRASRRQSQPGAPQRASAPRHTVFAVRTRPDVTLRDRRSGGPSRRGRSSAARSCPREQENPRLGRRRCGRGSGGVRP